MSGSDTEQPVPEPASGDSPPNADAESPGADVEALAEQHRSDFLRAMAELENFRKRSAREIEAARRYGIERFAADLLPVADTLALALESAGSVDPGTLVEGQRATLRLLHKAFEASGLIEFDPSGQPFDPDRHEAMAMRDSAEHPAHTVLEVVQKGWLLNGRLLRPARVIVSQAPAATPAPADG